MVERRAVTASLAANEALNSAEFENRPARISMNGSSDVMEPKEKLEIGNKETKQVLYTRALVLTVLLVVAATTSTLVFLYSKDLEEDAFKNYFDDIGNKISSEFISGADRRISAIEGFAEQITSHVVSDKEIDWPNVALPDFERRAQRTMRLSDVLSMAFFLVVTEEERASWEAFSVANQGWLKEGLEFQGIPEEEYNEEWIGLITRFCREQSSDLQIPDQIWPILEGETANRTYTPFWQSAPAIPVGCQVNYDGFINYSREPPLRSVIQNHKPFVTASLDPSTRNDATFLVRQAGINLYLQHGGNQEKYENGPAADVYVPVFTSFDETEVGGALSAYVYWQTYFENILPERDVGVYVVLENTCRQNFTYRLDGSDATYIGPGEHYDSSYESMRIDTHYGSFAGLEYEPTAIPPGQCLYRIRVYPSEELQDIFVTKNPMRFSIILAATFVFTSLFFLLYDFLVERRQRLVMNTAVKSTAVVASLFPEEVRDRLYEKETAKLGEDKKTKQAKTFTTVTNDPERIHFAGEEESDGVQAIADSYQNCSVQFCDIVGFTKWSSTREPRDVFKLLETIYKSFDKAASKLGVFKVETIGDCYVSVTGLPHAQPDHAILMALFSSECLLKVGRVTERLTPQLGPDTAKLTVRIGVHSGPVTAGVLRGAKARFQLFGDTVNTAARMESTGAPTKIQLSAATAELLISSGRGDWVTEREEEVQAKGKGLMQTYWLKPVNTEGSTVGSTAMGSE